MHIQYNIQGWTVGLVPGMEQAIVACDMASIFEECFKINPKSIRILRHVDDGLQVFSESWEGAKWLARRWWATFIDGTFREKYAQYTNYVKGYNEIYANSQTVEEVRQRVLMERALAHIWNTEYRVLPEYSHIRPVLGSAAIGNDIPEATAEVAVEFDCILSYHAYVYMPYGKRPVDEFKWRSGRIFGMYDRWKVKPKIVFTEGGPYESTKEGWRSHKCLGGNVDEYIAIMRTQMLEIMQTQAYKDGNVIAPPVWFTSDQGDRWKEYLTNANELKKLATMMSNTWIPNAGLPTPPPVVYQPMEVIGRYGLNIRKEPSINADRVGYLFRGSWFVPTERRVIGNDIWLQTGSLGWSAERYNGIIYLRPYGVEIDLSGDY